MAGGQLTKSAVVAAVALFAAACSGNAASSTTAADGAPSSPPTSTSPVPSTVPVASTAPVPSTVSSVSAAPSTAAVPASATPPATTPATSCPTYAATHTFAEVTVAKENSDGSVTITAHRATVVCGGVDDLHYDITAATEKGTVTPSGKVQMLTGVVQEQTVPHTDVSARLAADDWGRIFMVTGPLSGITALTEMYHP